MNYSRYTSSLLLACVLSACSSSANPAADAGLDASVSKPCPSGRGPNMARIPDGAGGTVCIDSTEVTRSQYAAFVADPESRKAPRPGFCPPAGTDDADQSCMAEVASCGANCANHPQVCVEWCSARAFCSWAGKKLCPMLSWLNACGGGLAPAPVGEGQVARSRYPYGNEYDPNACNTSSRKGTGCDDAPATCGATDVGTLPKCQGTGPYAGVLDLSGNVNEWVDSYSQQSPPSVVYGGGGFRAGGFGAEIDSQCALVGGAGLTIEAKDIGFRCCAD